MAILVTRPVQPPKQRLGNSRRYKSKYFLRPVFLLFALCCGLCCLNLLLRENPKPWGGKACGRDLGFSLWVKG